MPLLIGWMIFMFLFSAFPDLSLIYNGSWSNRSHHYLIDLHKIKWDVVFSWNNPFFRIPNFNYLYILINKMGHVVLFSVLGLLAFRATGKVGSAFWICVSYAFFDELHQALTPGRSARLTDVVLDSVTALLVILIAYSLYRKSKSRARHKKKPDFPR